MYNKLRRKRGDKREYIMDREWGEEKVDKLDDRLMRDTCTSIKHPVSH
jgi:hypothetical protein